MLSKIRGIVVSVHVHFLSCREVRLYPNQQRGGVFPTARAIRSAIIAVCGKSQTDKKIPIPKRQSPIWRQVPRKGRPVENSRVRIGIEEGELTLQTGEE